MIGHEEKKKLSLVKRNGKGWKERGKRSDGRRRRERSGKRFEGEKKLCMVYVLRGPGMFPVTFVRGMDEAETLTFLCPVMSATNENHCSWFYERIQSMSKFNGDNQDAEDPINK